MSDTPSFPDQLVDVPAELTSLVGREALVGLVRERLSSSRLVVLVGPGGIGKTRIAVAVARQLDARLGMPHWVGLDEASGTEVLSQVAAAFHLTVGEPSAVVQAIATASAAVPRVVVMDNCEHVVHEAAQVATQLLSRCPGVRILATSREPLGIPGEVTLPVVPLAVPSGGGIAALEASEAGQLFLARAREAQPQLVLTNDTVDAAARICRELEGWPLALELAAASVRHLPLEAIATRLDDTRRVLRHGSRLLPERHRTLEATLSWSWSLLAERQQELLQALSVFRGGFPIEGAEFIATALPGGRHDDSLELLAQLVDRSLVTLSEQDGVARYRLLEPTRQYAARQLAASGLEQVAREAHARWVTALGREVAARLGERGWWPVALTAAERENIVEAVRFLMAQRERAGDALSVLDDLWLAFLWGRGLGVVSALARRLVDAIDAESRDTSLRARARMVAAYYTLHMDQPDETLGLARGALEGARQSNDVLLLARSLDVFAWAASTIDAGAARAAAEEVASLLPTLNHPLYYALFHLTSPALLAAQQQDWSAAKDRYRTAEGAWMALGINWGVVTARHGLALVATGQGQWAEAARLARSTLDDFPEETISTRAWAIGLLGIAALGAGSTELAAQLLAAQSAVRQRMGVLPTNWERMVTDALVANVRGAMEASAFDRAWRAGLALSDDEALALTMRVPTATAEYAIPAREEPARVSATLPACRVSLLGPFSVSVGDVPLPAQAWPYAKPRELCAYLACHPQGRTREQIGAALWPDLSPPQVKNNLHVTIHHVRRALGGSARVVFAGGRYKLSGVVTDVAEFEDRGTRLRRTRETAQRRELQRELVTLWRGEFCAGEVFGNWAEDERDHLRVTYVDALVPLGEAELAADRPAEALTVFRRALEEDPTWEAAHRGLLRSLVAMGRRQEAMTHAVALVERLATELDAPPSAETQRLIDSLASA